MAKSALVVSNLILTAFVVSPATSMNIAPPSTSTTTAIIGTMSRDRAAA
jgi:hypothetical protein